MGADDQGHESVNRSAPCEAADRSGPVDPQRRRLLTAGPTLLMLGGLAGSYGTFFAMAGRFLFPSDRNKAWVFVREVTGIARGKSVSFVSPAGAQVTVTRRAGEPSDQPPTVDEFLALSSVCPHLGCRVSWEPHNNRFFCPCHNGVFDPDGNPVSGPPAAAGQKLSQYPLQIIGGALYIEMPVKSVGATS